MRGKWTAEALCPVCDGRVVEVEDPDIRHRRMIYCKDCSSQFAQLPALAHPPKGEEPANHPSEDSK